MKLQELKERIDSLIQQSDSFRDLEVCIPNNKKGMSGGTPCTSVKSAAKGFDWNHKKFMIIPETEMMNIGG